MGRDFIILRAGDETPGFQIAQRCGQYAVGDIGLSSQEHLTMIFVMIAMAAESAKCIVEILAE